MFKNKKYLALVFTILWLSFSYAGLKGYHFWYAGFLVSFWACLSLLNFDEQTSLWFLIKKSKQFWKFYSVLFFIGFVADYFIGQKVANLWTYPYYSTLFDWLRLYFIIYPFGGLSILELAFWLSGFSKEKFAFLKRANDLETIIIDSSDHFVDIFLGLVLLAVPFSYILNFGLPYRGLFSYGFLVWAVVASVKFFYHIKHGWHWLAIIFSTLFMSILLHEVPNTVAYEWKYSDAVLLNARIFNIPVWVAVGWYIMILLMLRLWIRILWNKRKS